MTKRSDDNRVVITGMGWCTPLGDELEGTWKRLLAGESGVGPITRFDAATFPTNFAAECPDPDLSRFFADPSPYEHSGLHTRFALAAAAQAWKQAGLGDPLQEADPERDDLARRRIGVYLGSGEGPSLGNAFAESNVRSWMAEERRVDMRRWTTEMVERVTPAKEIEQEPNMPLRHIAQTFGAGGPAYNCLTACAASTQAVGEAHEVIRRGEADVMIAGGSHTMLHPLGVTGFIRLTALSSRNDDPAGACRPFDSSRDGFVMGEGAGMLILESLAHARRRGATALAEIVGFGSSADAFRITDIQPNGEGAQASMLEALEQAEIDPAGVDENGRPLIHYISAHGTGTQENDSIETRAIHATFGDSAGKIPVSSIKSMTGHLIAAAGAVEAMVCVQAIRSGMIPPTRNLRTPDPKCDLDYVPNEARDLTGVGGVRLALSNSFGFGGQNNTLILSRFED